jgi:hypothetical protein
MKRRLGRETEDLFHEQLLMLSRVGETLAGGAGEMVKMKCPPVPSLRQEIENTLS